MVLDAAKGIEEQTLKLFEVCRNKGIPIFTFINKCDRPGKEPLELLDEIEQKLEIQPYPINWPIGKDMQFCGLYDRIAQKLHHFERVGGGRFRAAQNIREWDELKSVVAGNDLEQAREELDLLSTLPDFDQDAFDNGSLTPVYFGSAINNFGVEQLLEAFVAHAPQPQPRQALSRIVNPEDEPFSAFVFKIQANMDPKHRDRLVFMRVCSGRFRRNMQALHVQSGRKVRLSFSHQLFGQERETVEECWPGDILGVSGQNDFGIGDTLTEAQDICFEPIPPFAPECFAYVHNTDSMNMKRFRAGLDALLQEKVVQRVYPLEADGAPPLLGAVGALQFDVVCARMENEYNAPIRIEQASWRVARWFDKGVTPEEIPMLYSRKLVRDFAGNLMILFENDWDFGYFKRENAKFTLHNSAPL